MGDTIVPLIFLLVAAVYYSGLRALTLTFISVLSCVVFEYLYRRIFGKSRSIGDLSAAVTGLITAFCIPVSAPLWFPVVGALFSIIVVKELFGGLGRNIFNPAAAAICMLSVTWPGIMETFPQATAKFSPFFTPNSFETGISALISLKNGALPGNTPLEMLIGYTPGNLGTSEILIIAIAAAVLLYRRIINWRIPFAFLGTIAVAALLFPRCPSGPGYSVVYELISGSVAFAAVFMATDPVTSPVTGYGRIFYGIACGVVTYFIRYFGVFPEGAFFAVLLVNPFVLAFDRLGWRLSMKGGRMRFEKE